MPKIVTAEASADIWVGVREAVNRLSTFAGGDRAAKELIQDRLRDMQFRVRADRYIEVEEAGATRAPVAKQAQKNGRFVIIVGTKPVRDETNVEVPRGLWAKSIDWNEDTASWRWGTGEFFVTFRSVARRFSSPQMRAKLVGVQLLDREITEILNIATASKAPSTPPLLKKEKHGGGRPPKDWDNWIAELAALIASREYSRGWNATDLIVAVNKRLEKRGLSEQDIDKVYTAACAVKKRIAALPEI